MISLLGRLLDVVFPRYCSVCSRRLSVGEQVICINCNLHLDRTFFSKKPYDNIMTQRFYHLLPIERSAAIFYYHAGSKVCNIVHDIKYNDMPQSGIIMGHMAASEVQPDGFFDGIDLIIPMPLAKNRQKERGYNQSDMIAQGVSEVTHLPILTNLVSRDRYKKSQTHLTPVERLENVEGIFHLKHPEQISGKHILLIDDVCTTGATLVSLGKELAKAGHVKISILTLGFSHT